MEENLTIKIGEIINGKAVDLDLNAIKNLLVVGKVGRGKTIFLKQFLSNFKNTNANVLVFDPKGVEYNDETNCKVITTMEEAKDTLQSLQQKIKDGNLDTTIFVVDESADYLLEDGKTKRIMCKIFENGCKGGILPVFATYNFKFLPKKLLKSVNCMVAFDYQDNTLLKNNTMSELEKYESIFYKKGVLLTQLKPVKMY